MRATLPTGPADYNGKKTPFGRRAWRATKRDMADDRRTFADKTELQHVPLLRTFGPSLPLGVVATLVYVGVCAWTYLTHGS